MDLDGCLDKHILLVSYWSFHLAKTAAFVDLILIHMIYGLCRAVLTWRMWWCLTAPKIVRVMIVEKSWLLVSLIADVVHTR